MCFSAAPSSGRRFEEEIEVVGAGGSGQNSHSLIFLDMYTNYSVAILAFNPAGEGPRSEPVSVRTLQVIEYGWGFLSSLLFFKGCSYAKCCFKRKCGC